MLRDHIIKGVTLNQKRIQELKGKQLDEFGEALALLRSTKQKAQTRDEAAGLLEVITDYANAWLLLQKYDAGTLETDRVHKLKHAWYPTGCRFPSLSIYAAKPRYQPALH